MKKQILLGLVLVSAMALPSFATLSTVQSGSSVRTASELKIKNLQLQNEGPVESVKLAAVQPNDDLLMFLSSYKPLQQSLLATTELKINLDNFEMEYVLKVQ